MISAITWSWNSYLRYASTRIFSLSKYRASAVAAQRLWYCRPCSLPFHLAHRSLVHLSVYQLLPRLVLQLLQVHVRMVYLLQ